MTTFNSASGKRLDSISAASTSTGCTKSATEKMSQKSVRSRIASIVPSASGAKKAPRITAKFYQALEKQHQKEIKSGVGRFQYAPQSRRPPQSDAKEMSGKRPSPIRWAQEQ
ncbi:hypothetical protein ACN47E_002911 [Coniothyrium glycines]